MRDLWRQRPYAALFLPISYLIWAAVAIRWITEFVEQDHPQTALITGVLLLFGVLLGLEPLITRGSTLRAHLYLAFQAMLIFLASLLHYELDFFALLYLPLCGQAVFLFPRPTDLVWVGILVLATVVGLIIQFGWPEGVSFIILYAAALLFVAAFSTITQDADLARKRSEELLAQLQAANEQLLAYADQAEKLAIANERNRLARDLHDSVAQTLYGLTLQSETASRKLAAGQIEAAQAELQAMGDAAQETLQETRLLIFELRPPILESEGLAAALRTRLDAVEARSGLAVHADLRATDRLPAQIEVGLYRIAQEALNNVMKHAQASQVWVSLAAADGQLALEVRDDGLGYELGSSLAGAGPRAGLGAGMGLQSMAERAEQIGAELTLKGAPGQGASVLVELPYG
jgi:signal transduction histidine kinase